ncbi:MAG: polysaccharide pyruvyl transferase family protein [Steroidobacteraceae bacterium]
MVTGTPVKLIAELQAKIHRCLDDFITGEPLALLDFPNIRNVGDSAIWLGEWAYLKSRSAGRPAYVSTMNEFSDDDLDARVPSGPIFIHGGGNFGDIWIGHQDFRELVLQRYPGRPVIQLPQSIHYRSKTRTMQTARAIAKHGCFTLLVRDEESQHFAEKHFDCRVILCPDMALCIGPLQGPEPELPVLAMLREDKEKAGWRDPSALQAVPVEDWISEPWLPVRLAKAIGVAGALGTMDPMRMRLGRYNAAARQRFGRGIRQIGRARALVTDRLHVHILSLLLGRPHAVLDNSYGKIERFMSAFTGSANLAYRAKSLADGVEWARAQGPGESRVRSAA